MKVRRDEDCHHGSISSFQYNIGECEKRGQYLGLVANGDPSTRIYPATYDRFPNAVDSVIDFLGSQKPLFQTGFDECNT